MPTAAPVRFDQPLAGLLIDEWVEVVPSRRETTGVTFHYDQPNSAAPQAILLAVPSDQREVWDLDSLEAVLHETMELARMRAAAPGSRDETVWVEDGLPDGASPLGDGEGWTWVRLHPEPLSGKMAHQSSLAAGMHQHFFQGAKASLAVSVGDRLFAHVYLDTGHLPREVMLQWNDGTWEHRAYWGENLIGWGTDGTGSRQFMGPLPPAGRWVRLEVPAASVGLDGRVLSGMAFTLWDGRATWDRAGKVSHATCGNGRGRSLDAGPFLRRQHDRLVGRGRDSDGRLTMASQIRLELGTDCPQMQDGLQARIHDPLWMLARQWQFGEFEGEDVGSPASAQVVVESASLSRYQPGPQSGANAAQSLFTPGARSRDLGRGRAGRDRRDGRTGGSRPQAGLHLGRHLSAEGVGQYRSLFLKSSYVLRAANG